MKSSEIKNKVFLQIKQSKMQAEIIADNNLEAAFKNEDFKTTYQQIKDINFEIAKKEFLNLKTSEDKKQLKLLTEKLESLAKTMGFKLNDFEPNYSCKICNDTGLVGSNYCSCYYQKLNKEIINNIGLSLDSTHTFNNVNVELYDDKEKIKKVCSTLETWCEKLNTTKYKTILISGGVGVGKTYLVDCICNELIKKNIVINYNTAFSLNNLFLKYRTNFLENKNALDVVLNCDVLIVDDLGAEPNLKNNEEFFYLLFNERLVKNKFTIVTTNFNPTQIMERYGERTFSRLFNKSNALNIKIDNADLRRIKK